MNRRSLAALALTLAGIATIAPARADFNPFGAYYDNVARMAKQGNAEAVLHLVSTGANPNQTDEEARTGLHYAAMNGNLRIAAILIRAGAELDVKDQFGNTPLHWAIERNQAEVARLLLEAGAKVDSENRDGLTPLMFAARSGNLDLVRLLIEKGADVRKTDYTGRNAAGWAEDSHNPAVRQALARALAARRP